MFAIRQLLKTTFRSLTTVPVLENKLLAVANQPEPVLATPKRNSARDEPLFVGGSFLRLKITDLATGSDWFSLVFNQRSRSNWLQTQRMQNPHPEA